MKGISRRATLIATMVTLTIAAGCQTAPPRNPSMGSISTVARNGPWRAVVIFITDADGTEMYSLFKRRRSQSWIEVPPGIYEITHTCAPAQFSYEEVPGQWRFTKWTTKLQLSAGDSIKFVAESGITLSGAMCEGKFFVPAGHLIQANRVIPR